MVCVVTYGGVYSRETISRVIINCSTCPPERPQRKFRVSCAVILSRRVKMFSSVKEE